MRSKLGNLESRQSTRIRHYRSKQVCRHRLAFELMEARRLLTSTIFIDFGAGIGMGNTLSTTVGDFKSIFGAGHSGLGTGTNLNHPNYGMPLASSLDFTPFALDFNLDSVINDDDLTALAAAVVPLVERAVEPFDFDVVVTTAASFADAEALVDANLNDEDGEFDAYNYAMLVTSDHFSGASLGISLAGQPYGIAASSDLANQQGNLLDEATLTFSDRVFADTSGDAGTEAFMRNFAVRLAYTITHEAFHTFSFIHSQGFLASGDVIRLHSATREEPFSVIRFDLPRQSPANEPNGYTLIANDTDIGLRDDNRNGIPDFAFVTGTGAHDLIQVAKSTSGSSLQVTVDAWADPSQMIQIASENYSINLQTDTEGGVLIDGGINADEIRIDAQSGVSFRTRGGTGIDTTNGATGITEDDVLVVSGTTAETTVLLIHNDAGVSSLEFRTGSVLTTIEFSEFERISIAGPLKSFSTDVQSPLVDLRLESAAGARVLVMSNNTPEFVPIDFALPTDALTVAGAGLELATVILDLNNGSRSIGIGSALEPVGVINNARDLTLPANGNFAAYAEGLIYLSQGLFTNGQGSITIESDFRVVIQDMIETEFGDINIAGRGIVGSHGIEIGGLGGLQSSDGDVNLKADSFFISIPSAGMIDVPVGNLGIEVFTAGVGINLGGNDVFSGDQALGISAVEFTAINTNSLIVGGDTTGFIDVSAPLTLANNYHLEAAGPVTIEADISGDFIEILGVGTATTHAINLINGSSLSVSPMNSIRLVADSLLIATDALIAAPSGSVTIEPRTAGTEIDLGGSDLLTGTFLKLGISSSELTRIEADTLHLGRSNNGPASGATGHIRVTAPVNLRSQDIDTLELRSAAFVGGPDAAAIDVPNLFVYSVMGTRLQGDNDVDVLAMHSAGTAYARFTDIDSFTVGSVAGFNGVTALDQPIELRSNTGTIHVAAPIITDNSGSITVHAAQSIDVTADVIATSGGISLMAEGLAPLNTIGVRVREGAAVATIGGPIVVSGQGSSGTTGGRDGVRVTGANSKISSISGTVEVTGVGGSGTQGSHYGVRVDNGGEITALGTGTLQVTGTGGAASGTFNVGVYVGGNDAKIRTVGGELNVDATGGGVVASGSNRGLWVDLGGSITTTSGSLNATGTGGIGNGGFNRGVFVERSTGRISSTSGNVTVTGYGGGNGSTTNDIGVHLSNGGQITTGGTATLRVEGHGGNGSGASQFGVRIQQTDSRIHHSGSSDPNNRGSIEVIGYGTATSHAVLIEVQNAVTVGTNADITISADSLNLTESPLGTINAGTGILTLQTASAGTPIDVGGADDLNVTAPVLGLSLPELQQVSAGVLRIGRRDSLGSGAIEVTSPLMASTIPQTVHFRTGDSFTSMNAIGIDNLAISAATGISLDATNALETISLSNSVSGTIFVRDFEDLTIGTVDQVAGITSVASSTTVTLENGFLNVQSPIDTSLGDNPLTLFAGQAITLFVPPGGVGGHITGGAGSITLTGNGQKPLTAGTGVSVSGVNVTTIGNGDITIVGKGGAGTGSSNHGVRVGNNSLVRPGGHGALNITGTAGGGSFSSGVIVTGANARIDSTSGDVTVVGSGHNLGTGINRGVWVTDGGVIASGGSTTVEGTAGTGSTSTDNQGIYVVNVGSRITADDSVTVRATGSSHAEALRVQSAGRIESDNAFNVIDIKADSIVITGATPGSIGTPDSVVRIAPLTNGTLINVGGADMLTGNPKTLGLTDAELDNVVGLFVEIGNRDAGPLTVSNPISHSNNLQLESGGAIAINSTLTLVNDKILRVLTSDRITQTGITITGGLASTTYEADRSIDIANHIYSGSGGITLDAFGTVSGSYKGLRIHSGANVSASGSGPVMLRGRGGSTGLLSHGIEVTGAGTVVESVNGTLTIVADGVSTSLLNHGLLVDQSAIIRSTGNGQVSVTGNAGPGGSSNGVRVVNSAEIRSASANITVLATGGENSQALELALNGRLLAGGPSTLRVMADSINLTSGGVLDSQTGALEVYPRTSTTPIDLGGPDVLTAGSKVLGIYVDEINQMFGSVLRVGSRGATASGSITVSQDIEPSSVSTLHLRSGEAIGGSGALIVDSLAVSASSGIDLQGSNYLGTVALHNNGSGAVSLREVNGVIVGAVDGVFGALAAGPLNPLTLTVDAGGFGGVSAVNDIRALGTDGSVTITAPRVLVRGLVSGGVLGTNITATGDIDANVSGVLVENGGTITATGAGPVSVQGTGGNGASGSNAGVWVFGSGSQITSSGGPVTIVGQGGSSTGPLNHGVRVSFGGTITSATPGSITVTGTGGNNSPGAFGVLVDNLNSRIAAAGILTVNGSGVASGVVLRDRGALVSVSASPLTVTTDSLLIDGPDANSLGSIEATGSIVTIAPQTAGTLMDLGGNDVLTGSPKTLGLTSAELSRITAGELRLGNTDTGRIYNSTNHTFDYPQVIIRNGSADIEAIGGWTFTGNLLVESGGSIYQGNNELNVAGLADFSAAGDVMLDGIGDPNGNQFNDLFVAGETIFIREGQDGFNFVGAEIETSLTIDSPLVVTQSAPLAGNGGLILSANSAMILDQVNTYTGLTVVGDSAMLSIDGEVPGNVQLTAGGVLSGNGTVGGDVSGLGSIRPGGDFGQALGVLRIDGATTISGEASFQVQGDDVAGEDYDRLIAGQGVDLSAVTAEFTGAFTSQPTQPIQVIENLSGSATIPFSNLAEGAVIVIDDVEFTITYLGGDGNDVELTPIETNQPPTAVRLENVLAEINENTATATRLKVADIVIDDDGLGENQLGLSGPQADSFEIDGLELFLRAGVVLDYETLAALEITIAVDDPAVGSSPDATANYSLEVVDLAEVQDVRVGDGTAQRSRVDQLVITFDGEVEIDAGAFTVQRRALGSNPGSVVTSTISTEVINGVTIATLTFSGSSTRANGALIDGNYQLLVDATKVTRAGNQLDGDRDGTTGGDYEFGTLETDNFFAQFGDMNGDRVIGFTDFVAFRSAFGQSLGQAGYSRLLDFDDDEVIGFADFVQFRSRFGTQLGFE